MSQGIALIQEGLIKLEYDPGPVDGIPGPKTFAAWDAARAAGGLPASAKPPADLTAFFDEVRAILGGRMSGSQVSGLETLMAATSGIPTAQRAYLLATAAHETAWTMQPITEYGGRRYFDKYDTGKLAKALGNTPEADGDGYLYRGRGYVQITGRANYARAGTHLGVDLIGNPDAALNPDIAARILVRGCSEGWFTGKRLTDYLPGDYIGARRVVNGTDRARDIARLAERFETALKFVH